MRGLERWLVPALVLLLAGVARAQPDSPAADDGSAAEPAPAAAVEARIRREREVIRNPFGITPHRPNYFLPLTYNNNPNPDPFESGLGVPDLDPVEIKFQISFKIPLLTGVFDDSKRLYFAYSQISFWQAYNSDQSSPFRETNHEPELMLTLGNDWRLFGFTNRLNVFGFAHQSNGRTEPLSRSWNRLYAQFILERGNLVLSIKPWWRIPESEEDDDNPDIESYLGHAEFQLLYARESRSRSATLRYNPSSGRGSLQLDWTFPVDGRLKGYLQYFNGYGESLIDYDARSHRIGVGVLLTDWL